MLTSPEVLEALREREPPGGVPQLCAGCSGVQRGAGPGHRRCGPEASPELSLNVGFSLPSPPAAIGHHSLSLGTVVFGQCAPGVWMAEGGQEALYLCLMRGPGGEAGSRSWRVRPGVCRDSSSPGPGPHRHFLSVATGDQVNRGQHRLISEFALQPQVYFKETAQIWESKFLSWCVFR